MEEILLYLSLKYQGDFERIYNAIETNEIVNEAEKEILLKSVKSNYTTMISPDYPEALKHIDCPPFVLYYYGDLSLLNSRNICIAGTRTPTTYGREVTEKITKELVGEKNVIISGLALGVDTIAHQTAIENYGKTVAVLDTGIDYYNLKSNTNVYQEIKNNHLLISEYPGEVSLPPQRFPKNRIISGLSDSILVTEANMKSSTMITVAYALEQNKEIYAIPGKITSTYQGTNCLIQQGVKLVTSAKDIEFKRESIELNNQDYSIDEELDYETGMKLS
jgi:DNA protecting protein DprA